MIWCLKESLHTKHLSFDIFTPPFHLWYLLSLFTWRMMLPYIQTLKYPFIITITCAFMVGFSQSISWPMSLSRTISLFPFFLLGSVCSPSVLYKIQDRKSVV